FFSSRRRHTRSKRDWSSDVCSSDLGFLAGLLAGVRVAFLCDLEVHEPVEDLQPGVALEDGLPQVGGGRAVRVGRVAGVVAVAAEIGRAACREGGWERRGGTGW